MSCHGSYKKPQIAHPGSGHSNTVPLFPRIQVKFQISLQQPCRSRSGCLLAWPFRNLHEVQPALGHMARNRCHPDRDTVCSSRTFVFLARLRSCKGAIPQPRGCIDRSWLIYPRLPVNTPIVRSTTFDVSTNFNLTDIACHADLTPMSLNTQRFWRRSRTSAHLRPDAKHWDIPTSQPLLPTRSILRIRRCLGPGNTVHGRCAPNEDCGETRQDRRDHRITYCDFSPPSCQ
jgi:hypothetical protein